MASASPKIYSLRVNTVMNCQVSQKQGISWTNRNYELIRARFWNGFRDYPTPSGGRGSLPTGMRGPVGLTTHIPLVLTLRMSETDHSHPSSADVDHSHPSLVLTLRMSETDHSHPSSADVKNEWNWPLTSLSSADVKNEWNWPLTSLECWR
jgi:hypothetical protein